MKKLLLPFLGLFVFAACNNSDAPANGDGSDTSASEGPQLEVPDGPQGCYLRIMDRDTAWLHLQSKGSRVTGEMLYDNYQIDGSYGTLSGSISGDTLHVFYNFFAEGTESVREIIFLVKDNVIEEASGGGFDIRGDSTLYAEPQQIKFDGSSVFRKGSCEGLDEKTMEWKRV